MKEKTHLSDAGNEPWSWTREVVASERVIHRVRTEPVATRRDVLERLIAERSARESFGSFIASAPMTAAFWETPPWTPGGLDEPFEFVLVESTALAGVAADPRPFAEHFAAAEGAVVVFSSLGGDARLVAPAPAGGHDGAHLLAFLRTATPEARDELWRVAFTELRDRLGPAPIWLSTSGLGVAWLHVRLDTVPKYYTFAPYRAARG